MNDKTRWGIISFVLVVVLASLFLYTLLVSVVNEGLGPELVLSIILVFGVIALVLMLTFMAVIFKSLELTDIKQTLGLPEGSVRAVIALSLILIFMISSVFLFFQVQSHESKIILSVNVTQEQIDKMPSDQIVSIVRINETSFNVSRKVNTGSETANDIAKQIITTVSTLVVAVAGFYFGTQAVSVAKGTVKATSSPVIRSIVPDKNEGKRDTEIPFEISGKNFESPKVKLIQGSNEITDFTDITSSPTKIKGLLKIPPKSDKYPDGKWTVVVNNSDAEEDRLENAFEVKETPAVETSAGEKPTGEKPANETPAGKT